MRALLLLAVLAAAVAVVPASGVSAPAKDVPSFSMEPLRAEFVPKERTTHYSIFRLIHKVSESMTVTWTIHLQLVDKAGAPDPAQPGATAAVDLGCTNNGVGLPGHPKVEVVLKGHAAPPFAWHHPDAADSVPPGVYHCNHDDMGPHGHQGLITVVVSDKEWECTATYKGTNSSSALSVENGTASEPRCKKLG